MTTSISAIVKPRRVPVGHCLRRDLAETRDVIFGAINAVRASGNKDVTS